MFAATRIIQPQLTGESATADCSPTAGLLSVSPAKAGIGCNLQTKSDENTLRTVARQPLPLRGLSSVCSPLPLRRLPCEQGCLLPSSPVTATTAGGSRGNSAPFKQSPREPGASSTNKGDNCSRPRSRSTTAARAPHCQLGVREVAAPRSCKQTQRS